ncbi:MAG: hypothetical protein IPK63_15565 [Candidatus Competibacteraceae bacterium]|nr:hypothetical protein [Candidatus Competibacteraceae bacterium]
MTFPLMTPQVRFACVYVAQKGANERDARINAATAIKAAGDPAGAFLIRPFDDRRNMVLTGPDALRELDKPKLEVLA